MHSVKEGKMCDMMTQLGNIYIPFTCIKPECLFPTVCQGRHLKSASVELSEISLQVTRIGILYYVIDLTSVLLGNLNRQLTNIY